MNVPKIVNDARPYIVTVTYIKDDGTTEKRSIGTYTNEWDAFQASYRHSSNDSPRCFHRIESYAFGGQIRSSINRPIGFNWM